MIPTGRIRWRVRPSRRYRYVRWRWRLMCGLIDAVGAAIWQMFHWIRQGCAWLVGFSEASSGDLPVRRILILQLDHLGDAVLSQVMFPFLRRRWPGAEIHVLASPWNQEIFQMIPEVDQLFLWPRNRFQREGRQGLLGTLGWLAALLGWAWRLRAWKYDLAIDVRGELPHGLLMWLAGVRRRVGWASGGGGFLLTDWPAYRPCRPELHSRLALLDCLGLRPEPPGRPPWPKLTPPQWARENILLRLAEAQKTAGSGSNQAASDDAPKRPARLPMVVCHIGAGTEAKQWPLEHWADLADQLLAQGKMIILVGAQADQPKAQAILRRLQDPRQPKRNVLSGRQSVRVVPAGPGAAALWDWTGRLSVAELAALLEQAELFVGADSGPAHMAAAVGTPVVVLMSGTNRAIQWRPRGPAVRVLRRPTACRPCHRTRCPLPDHPCMSRITPPQVLEAIDRLSAGRHSGADSSTGFFPAPVPLRSRLGIVRALPAGVSTTSASAKEMDR